MNVGKSVLASQNKQFVTTLKLHQPPTSHQLCSSTATEAVKSVSCLLGLLAAWWCLTAGLYAVRAAWLSLAAYGSKGFGCSLPL